MSSVKRRSSFGEVAKDKSTKRVRFEPDVKGPTKRSSVIRENRVQRQMYLIERSLMAAELERIKALDQRKKTILLRKTLSLQDLSQVREINLLLSENSRMKELLLIRCAANSSAKIYPALQTVSNLNPHVMRGYVINDIVTPTKHQEEICKKQILSTKKTLLQSVYHLVTRW